MGATQLYLEVLAHGDLCTMLMVMVILKLRYVGYISLILHNTWQMMGKWLINIASSPNWFLCMKILFLWLSLSLSLSKTVKQEKYSCFLSKKKERKAKYSLVTSAEMKCEWNSLPTALSKMFIPFLCEIIFRRYDFRVHCMFIWMFFKQENIYGWKLNVNLHRLLQWKPQIWRKSHLGYYMMWRLNLQIVGLLGLHVYYLHQMSIVPVLTSKHY